MLGIKSKLINKDYDQSTTINFKPKNLYKNITMSFSIQYYSDQIKMALKIIELKYIIFPKSYIGFSS